jgi:opacity protein-like surface antigen
MRKILAATACSILAFPAFAAGPTQPVSEPYVEAPVPAAPVSFNWTGGYVGAQIGYGDVDTDVSGVSDDGLIGGLHAGYNWDMGDWVWGVEADWDLADIDFGTGVGDVDNIARLKGKIGRDFGRTLVYGTAGGVWVDGDFAGRSQDDIGWLVGGGVDYALTNNWIAGGEALYHEISSFDDTGADVDAWTFRAKLSYKF